MALVDVRVLHAARDNCTDERRSMITCWCVYVCVRVRVTIAESEQRGAVVAVGAPRVRG